MQRLQLFDPSALVSDIFVDLAHMLWHARQRFCGRTARRQGGRENPVETFTLVGDA